MRAQPPYARCIVCQSGHMQQLLTGILEDHGLDSRWGTQKIYAIFRVIRLENASSFILLSSFSTEEPPWGVRIKSVLYCTVCHALP